MHIGVVSIVCYIMILYTLLLSHAIWCVQRERGCGIRCKCRGNCKNPRNSTSTTTGTDGIPLAHDDETDDEQEEADTTIMDYDSDDYELV